MQTKTKIIGLTGIVMAALAGFALLNRIPMQEPKREDYNGPATVMGRFGNMTISDFNNDGNADLIRGDGGEVICVAPEYQDSYYHPRIKKMTPELRKLLSNEIILENEIDYQLSLEFYKQRTDSKISTNK